MAEIGGRISIQRRGNSLNLRTPSLQVSYDLSNGTWQFQDRAGFTVIRNAYASVRLKDGTILSTLRAERRSFSTEITHDDPLGPSLRVKFSHLCPLKEGRAILNVYLHLFDSANHLVAELSLRPEDGAKLEVHRVDVITVSPEGGSPVGGIYLGSQVGSWKAYLNLCGDHPLCAREIEEGSKLTGELEPYHDGVIYDMESRRSVTFGFLSFRRWWGSIEIGYDPEMQPLRNYKGINRWSLYQIWGRAIEEETFSEPVYINYLDGFRFAQRSYAELISKLMDGPSPPPPALRWRVPPAVEAVEGWVKEGLERLAAHPERLPLGEGGVEYLELREWERWRGVAEEDRSRFPSGMADLIETAHRFGVKVALHFPLFEVDAEYPELREVERGVLRDADGVMVRMEIGEGRRVFLLDPTAPEAAEFVGRQIERIRSWGADALVLDMSNYAIHLDPAFKSGYKEDLTGVEAYRKGLRLAAEKAKGMTLIPRFSHTGYNAGIVGVGTISSPVWSNPSEIHWEDKYGLPEMIRFWAGKLYLHGPLWTNNFEPISISEPRPLNEVAVLLTACALSGGMIAVEDALPDISDERLEMLRKLLPLYGRPATPIDLMESERPRVWALKVGSRQEEWWLVGVFNWEDSAESISIRMGELGLSGGKSYLVHEFWTGEFIGEFQRTIDLYDVPPRSAMLLCVREQKEIPQLLSTDIHFTQGAVEILNAGWDRKSSSLLISLRGGRRWGGRLFIYSPPDFIPSSVACHGTDYSYTWRPPILTLNLSSLEDVVTVAVGFWRSRG